MPSSTPATGPKDSAGDTCTWPAPPAHSPVAAVARCGPRAV